MSRVVDGRATPVAAFRKTSTYLDEERGEKTRSVEYCYSPMSNPRTHVSPSRFPFTFQFRPPLDDLSFTFGDI